MNDLKTEKLNFGNFLEKKRLLKNKFGKILKLN